MAFPSSPVNGQSATLNGISYTYSSTTNSWTRTASTLISTVYTQANSAYALASNSLPITGGTITGNLLIKNASTGNTSTILTDSLGNLILNPSANGSTQLSAVGTTVTVTNNMIVQKDLTVSGNLIITGNVSSQNVQQLAVADPLIILGLGNYVSDTKDIGFAAHYNDGVNAHAGLIRDSGTKEFYLFKGYTPEIDATNNVDITDASFSTANLNSNYVKANLIAQSLVVNGYTGGTSTPTSIKITNQEFSSTSGLTSKIDFYGGQYGFGLSAGNLEYITSTGNHTFYTNSGIRMQLLQSGQLNLLTNIASTSNTTGTLTVGGGVGITGNVNMGSTLSVSGNVTTPTITSTNVISANITTNVLLPTYGNNLFYYSSNLANAYWNYYFTTATQNQNDPFGGTKAVLMTAAGVSQVYNTTPLNAETYTVSWYAKAGTARYTYLQINNDSPEMIVCFDLFNGTVSQITALDLSANITSVGNGWYRCSVVLNQPSATTSVVAFCFSDVNNSSTIASGNTAYFAAPQLEYGSYLTPYAPTTSGIIANAAILIPSSGLTITGNLAIQSQITGNTSTILTDSLGNLILSPAANGAIQASITDNSSNGNVRGVNAVDLQTVRAFNVHVASGISSAILSGNNNQAPGYRGPVVGGAWNNNSGSDSFLGGGYSNYLSGINTVISGGAYNSVQGGSDYSTLGAGFGNQIGVSGSTYNFGRAFLGGGVVNRTTGIYDVLVGGQYNNTGAYQIPTASGVSATTYSNNQIVVSSTTGISVGNRADGTNITFDSYVLAINGTTLTLSQNAYASGATTLSFHKSISTVVGGANNTSNGAFSFVGGGGGPINNSTNPPTYGLGNAAAGDWSAIVGGQSNLINSNGGWGFIGGGYNNVVGWYKSSIVGGESNIATGTDSIVGGGNGNNAQTTWGGIFSGLQNNNQAYRNFIGAGYGNIIYQGPDDSSIVGGYGNKSGGASNYFCGQQQFIGGGYYNQTYGQGDVIAGGRLNTTGVGSLSAVAATATLYGTSNNQIVVSSASGINPGDWVYNYGQSIYADTFVTAVNGTTLTLNQNTSASGSATNLGFAKAYGTIVGGYNNVANGAFSFVGGGGGPWRYDLNPNQSGGNGNNAAANWSAIVGGQGNWIVSNSDHAFIGGGNLNLISGADHAAIVGGTNNQTSAQYGFTGGGNSNLTYGGYAVIGGGFNNGAGYMSAVCGGQFNSNGQSYAFVGGGYNNATGASYTTIGGGYQNQATGLYSAILGGNGASTRGVSYAQAFGNNPWSKYGSSQLGTYILSANTNSATANTMTSDWNYPATTVNQVTLVANSAYIFKGSVVGLSNTNIASAWTFEGLINQGATRSTTRLVGTPIINLIAQDGLANTWSLAITANTTLGALQVSVTGASANTVRWVGKVDTTEVTF